MNKRKKNKINKAIKYQPKQLDEDVKPYVLSLFINVHPEISDGQIIDAHQELRIYLEDPESLLRDVRRLRSIREPNEDGLMRW